MTEEILPADVMSAEAFDGDADIYLIAEEHQTLTDAFLVRPALREAGLPCLVVGLYGGSAAESRRPLTQWNAHTSMPSPTLTAAFAAQVARTPDPTALISQDAELPYAEANARANRLAHRPAGRGAGPGRRRPRRPPGVRYRPVRPGHRRAHGPAVSANGCSPGSPRTAR
ncbi:hypothetical protein ACI2L4_34385 [Streptomyces sparsogenes]|uniref:hypothetical protein n=1 Tax=Streptomyces sparsogenes TaxID=67365 RepID=UPI0033E95217